ncbi:MAG: flagellar hook-associated protein FlgK, partial [Gammaproteobacteria bacterium]|nr:flagellar hook-associated protein FlgK [Gammaproteobacteria bacterium]
MTNASLLSIGVSGLDTYRAALATTGQNITNAATPGYTRQRAEIESRTIAGGSGGAGSRVLGITRILDEVAIGQIRMDTAAFNELSVLSDQILRVDLLLSDDNSSLNQGFNRFFTAVQSAIQDPNSLPARQLVISEARGLVARFNSLDERLRTQLGDVNSELVSTAVRVNELAQSIAEINGRIRVIDLATGSPNELMDQRDELLRQLAELVNVQVDSNQNVFIGKGQPLVVGQRAASLGITRSGEITFMTEGRDSQEILTDSISGGRLGGLLVFQRDVLIPSLDQLGRIAIAFASTANEVHSRGINLSGEFGGLLFTDVNDPLEMVQRAVQLTNIGSSAPIVDVRIDDGLSLRSIEYELIFADDSSGHFFVTRGGQGEIAYSGVLSGEVPQELSFDGMTLVLGGGDYAGNRFSILATRRGAENIGLVIEDPSDLALAAPVRLESNPTNEGTGSIDLAAIYDVDHPLFSGPPELLPPLLIRFTSPTRYDILDNSDPINPVPLVPALEGLDYVPGSSNAVLPGTGQTVIQSSGNNVGAFPPAPVIVTGLTSQTNGYDAESVTFFEDDPFGGSPTIVQFVNFTAGSSARQIAQQLSTTSGVTASGYTETTITGITDNGYGEQLALVINGVRFDQPGMTLNSLADAINASSLTDQGILALSDGQTLRLSSALGDDISVYVSGDITDSVEFESVQGQRLLLNGVGPGSRASTAGSINVSGGANFSIGGPHTLTVAIDNQPAVTINLTGVYTSGAGLAAAVQAELDATVLNGAVSVGLSSSGELQFSTMDAGSDASIDLSGISSGVALLLGLTTQGAVGVDTFRTMTVGGRVNLLLDSGRSVTSDVINPAGNVFTRNPVANSTDFGFEVNMTGRPVAGDTFTIDFNAGGVLDNRNGQALADLRLGRLLGDPPQSFNDSYSGLVEFIGIKASQTGLNR